MKIEKHHSTNRAYLDEVTIGTCFTFGDDDTEDVYLLTGVGTFKSKVELVRFCVYLSSGDGYVVCEDIYNGDDLLIDGMFDGVSEKNIVFLKDDAKVVVS